jgi:hypothetical protein
MKGKKKVFTIFGALTLLGSVAAGAYYFVFMRGHKPQVELYFDDGSMVALPADTPEAEPFVSVANEILKASPVAD